MLPLRGLGRSLRTKVARVVDGVPILMYHLVSDDAPDALSTYTVTPAEFRRQVSLMILLGCTSITPDQLLAARRGTALPRRPVLITFDDGYRECLKHAAPVLHAAGLQATMYVVAGLLGGTSRWLAGTGADLNLVTAAEARELEQAGVRCESHSFTHPRLATLDPIALRHELRASRAALEDVLGREVRHLAYPHGSHDGRVLAEAADAGYRTGCTTVPAKALPADDVLALPRVKVDGRDRDRDLVARLLTGKDAGFTVRRVTGRSRGR